MQRTRLNALRTALQDLQARRFDAALTASGPWAGDPDGALLHALALAGSGAVEQAAPLLARIARANPGRNHPVQDLLPLLPVRAGLAHVQAALRLMPDDARLLAALGAALAETGPMADCLAAFERVTRTRPGDAVAWSNLGKALSAEARFAEAGAAFATALRLAPGTAQIEYNRAAMLLKSGRLAEGWVAFRARHALPGRPPPLPGRRLTTLDGVAGRTVLLAHDEGFGDTLQFVRYARLLSELGATVLAQMPRPLQRLVRAVPGVSAVTTGATLPRYDAWCPLLDLPPLFGTTLDTIPAGIPYLRTAATATAAWADRLPRGRRIGLAWAGDPAGLADRTRSMDPAALEPLRAVPDIHWVSLQFGTSAPPWMLDPMPGMADFADTAAVVATLDAVVSVDTAVAHLAGGLGVPVLLLDRHDNCWRWLAGRSDSPWYPAMRLVRQGSPGDWAGVVRQAAALLNARFTTVPQDGATPWPEPPP